MLRKTVSIILAALLALSVLPGAMAANTQSLENQGQCGDSVMWYFSGESGELKLSGEGSTYDYKDNLLNSSPFYNDDSIVSVVIESDITGIGEALFSKCSAIESVVIGDDVKKIGKNAFEGCESLFDVSVPIGVDTIGEKAFYKCESLEKLSLPNSLKTIGKDAFAYCKSLTEITVPNGVTEIADHVFQYCGGLKKAELGRNIKKIGYTAFGDCKSLEEIKLPDELTEIDDAAFMNCVSVQKLYIPKTLTRISDYSFYGCDNLKEVRYYGTKSEWDKVTVRPGNKPIEKATLICDEDTSVSAPSISLTNVISSGKIKLSWDKIQNASEYKIYRSSEENGEYRYIFTTEKCNYTNTSAKMGEKYFYKVKAIGTETESDYSNTVCGVCKIPAPAVTMSSIASSGKIKVSWNEISGAKGYNVFRSESKNGTYKLMKTTTNLSYVNTSAQAGKIYWYKVQSVALNEEASSMLTSAKYRTCDLPRPVVSWSATAKNQPKLTWAAVEGAVSYKVYRSDSENGSYKLLKTTSSLSFTNTSITSGQYFYKVKAVASDTNANSAYSTVCKVKLK